MDYGDISISNLLKAIPEGDIISRTEEWLSKYDKSLYDKDGRPKSLEEVFDMIAEIYSSKDD